MPPHSTVDFGDERQPGFRGLVRQQIPHQFIDLGALGLAKRGDHDAGNGRPILLRSLSNRNLHGGQGLSIP